MHLVLRLFDISTGHKFSNEIKHEMEIVEVALDHFGPALDRNLVFIKLTVSLTSKLWGSWCLLCRW